MKFKKLKLTLAGLIISVCSLNSNAGLIDANSVLLDDAGATQLETWLGQGDLDWDSIWYGATGATADSWHTAVNSAGPTVSIYKMTNGLSNFIVGGYTDLAWSGSAPGYKSGNGNSFIFNITAGNKYGFAGIHSQLEILSGGDYFATFGSGFDLYGGNEKIGSSSGHSFDYSYTSGAANAGQLNGEVQVDQRWTVLALETFTMKQAASVPEPSTLAIFTLGMIGLASRRFKKQS